MKTMLLKMSRKEYMSIIVTIYLLLIEIRISTCSFKNGRSTSYTVKEDHIDSPQNSYAIIRVVITLINNQEGLIYPGHWVFMHLQPVI